MLALDSLLVTFQLKSYKKEVWLTKQDLAIIMYWKLYPLYSSNNWKDDLILMRNRKYSLSKARAYGIEAQCTWSSPLSTNKRSIYTHGHSAIDLTISTVLNCLANEFFSPWQIYLRVYGELSLWAISHHHPQQRLFWTLRLSLLPTTFPKHQIK